MTVRPNDRKRAEILEAALSRYEAGVAILPGVRDETIRSVLVAQMIESLRRIVYAHHIRDGEIDPRRADPSSQLFDPIRAAVWQLRRGNFDEAFWLIFLQTHFGRDGTGPDSWGLVRAVYGALGGDVWTWDRVYTDMDGFRRWLSQHEDLLRSRYNFGNHRKYQSISGLSRVGTGAVVASYVAWVNPPRTHQQMIQAIHREVGQNPRDVFQFLFKSMKSVMGFGRLGRFDYLTMLGKLGVAPIDPDSAYLSGATGPLAGARLLFANNPKAKLSARSLDEKLLQLDTYLEVGMQVFRGLTLQLAKKSKQIYRLPRLADRFKIIFTVPTFEEIELIGFQPLLIL